METLTGKRTSDNIAKLIELLKKCKADGFIHTIIFVEDRVESSQPVLQIVRGLAKALTGYCCSIIVLSE